MYLINRIYVELNVFEQRDNCRRETETRRQRDGRDGPITPSRSVVATREGLSDVFRGSLRAKSPEARSQVSGRFDILKERNAVLLDLLSYRLEDAASLIQFPIFRDADSNNECYTV